MSTAAVIPARYASTRFPGKPLAPIAGRAMIAHVVDRVRSAHCLSRVVVATDDERIAREAEAAGAQARMTPVGLESGTDRVAYVARDMPEDVIINIQGDEPLIDPLSIALLVEILEEPEIQMASLKVPLKGWQEYENPNVVKVVVDARGDALYFSRAPIPYTNLAEGTVPAYKHIGIYAYRRATLLALAAMPPAILEKIERLEQLRALVAGIRIRIGDAFSDSIGVDRPADIAKVELLMLRQAALKSV